MSEIGLYMIVKDEAHIIERCLRSALPFVDWWVIVDTGSIDGTQDVVRRVLDGVPGELHERPWVDFGHNRQESLELAAAFPARSADSYALWIDADDQFTSVPDERPDLTLDGYHVTNHFGATSYSVLRLTRLDRPWRWQGVVHEHLALPGADVGSLDVPSVHEERAGARSLDPDKYRKDAALLEGALARTPDDPRTQFYLAQSWRDAGELERALAAYRTRSDNANGWDQERWYARFQAAVISERLARPDAEVVAAYLTAYAALPSRAEPLVELARFHRERELHAVARLFATPATSTPHPGRSALFVDESTYSWRAWDELAVSCYWTGAYAEGLDAAERALAVHPDDERLRANVAFCREKTLA
ncbi:MAG: hypothetical protein JWN68_2551 [Nocardioides sp.]|uniref:tetratricopeptide repeat-containing glycosyltransferase n=1 Tax=Nocardioides sp. TaxID=35761 RepID=UPI002604F87F|nr:hypothetical protein [Nocardioides sp.]MCW2834598.1 hypothetical protein [Nocardioides sp.]